MIDGGRERAEDCAMADDGFTIDLDDADYHRKESLCRPSIPVAS